MMSCSIFQADVSHNQVSRTCKKYFAFTFLLGEEKPITQIEIQDGKVIKTCFGTSTERRNKERALMQFFPPQGFYKLYVYVLYPMSPVTLCASVYMMLAITVERYLAVCKPLTYRNMNSTTSSTRRVAYYVVPVAAASLCLNIPKFLEVRAHDGDNVTASVQVTEMRLNPTYIFYYTISQIFHPTLTTGILPMAALIYMNTHIFFGKSSGFRGLSINNLDNFERLQGGKKKFFSPQAWPKSLPKLFFNFCCHGGKISFFIVYKTCFDVHKLHTRCFYFVFVERKTLYYASPFH